MSDHGMRQTRFACLLIFVASFACNKNEPIDSGSNLEGVASSALKTEQTVIDSIFERWVPGTVRVEAVVYDCEEGRGDRTAKRPLVMKGEKHPFIDESKTTILNSEQITQLAELLNASHDTSNPAYCYVPHHGFLFYNATGEVHAHVEICFLCERGVARPREGLADIWDYDGLKVFVASLGLPVFDSVAEWDEYFAKNPRNR